MSSSICDTLFSQFVEFTVVPLHAQDLTRALVTRVDRYICFCPGFISAQVHVSELGDRVLLQLMWCSIKHSEQAFEMTQKMEPDLFQLGREHHARALLFSAYNTVMPLGKQRNL